ncbi:uncharacterized protein LOC108648133 [Xenopus tropicalis]|uniref:Uncharacterized protein LOC108648133 n=1 Tax=Xenopus tropicalis TaxID=8364 RepID=A0A8J1JZC7_XENTR|nr:uncharacterized protein LOC108648133 [Xenopus tropicalis]
MFSIECKSCHVNGYSHFSTCNGETKVCDSKYDSCGSLYLVEKKAPSENMFHYQTGCWESKNCNKTMTATSLGIEIMKASYCCNTDNCTPLEPAIASIMKPKNSTRNGVLCPACYKNDFKKAVCPSNASMACTGDETTCIAVNHTTFVSKGCGTPGVCQFFGNLHYEFKEIDKASPLSVVNSLLCPVYHSVTDASYIYPVHCENGEDVCLTEKLWTINDKRNTFELIRRCGKAAECSRVGTYSSSTKRFAINTTCCNSSMCLPPIPMFPLQTATENGLACPTCFASNSRRCTEEDPLKCVGNENRCIRYVKNEYYEKDWQIHCFAGCTTESICRLGSSRNKFLFLTNQTFKTITMDMTCSGSMGLNVPFSLVIILVGLRIIMGVL